MNFTLKLNHNQIEAMQDYYKSTLQSSPNPYIKALIKKPRTTITIYTSNTVLFQGEDSEFEMLFWCDTFGLSLPKEKPIQNEDFFLTSIGSDESGVGDFFGPLTVVSAYVKKTDRAFLESLDVKDSKSLTDKKIKAIAPSLIKHIPHSLLVLTNPQYNDLTKKGYNAHKLKAHMHAQTHKHVLDKIATKPIIVVDQFCDKNLYLKYTKDFDRVVIPDIFKTKAESYYASVAVASIIARYSFITHLERLSNTLGMTLPKGAGAQVDACAKQLVKAKGMAILHKVAKTHFKTIDKINV